MREPAVSTQPIISLFGTKRLTTPEGHVSTEENHYFQKKSLSVVDDLYALDIKVNNKITGNTSSNNSLVEKNMEDNAP